MGLRVPNAVTSAVVILRSCAGGVCRISSGCGLVASEFSPGQYAAARNTVADDTAWPRQQMARRFGRQPKQMEVGA